MQGDLERELRVQQIKNQAIADELQQLRNENAALKMLLSSARSDAEVQRELLRECKAQLAAGVN
jgi:hypothetical protein